MTEKDHIQIFDKHSKILNEVLQEITKISTNTTNLSSKLDSLENRFDGLSVHRIGDIISFKDTLKKELEASEQRIEIRIEKRIDGIVKDVENTQKDIKELSSFKAEINGKRYGAILGVSAVFAIVTFLLNKFISV